MPSPTPYLRLKNFTQYALDHPSAMYSGSDHDAEFDAVFLTLSGLVTNINRIQRNDGLLANATVHPDAISIATKALIGAGSTGNLNWTPKGLWATATNYAVADVVETAATSYVCSTAHLSGVFATDKAAGKWVTLGGTVLALTAAAVSFIPSGGIAAADVQAALQELDGEKAKLAGDGAVNFSVKAATAAAHAVPFSQAQDGSMFFAVGTGTGNAILATIATTGNTVLKDGMEFCIRAPGANSITNPRLDLTLGATDTGNLPIVRGDSGGALNIGDIVGASHEMRLRYKSGIASWMLMNPGLTPVTVNNVPSQQALVDYLHIDSDTGHRDMIRGGYMPAFFNQQWGGAPHYFELVDGATGVPYIFEAATGYIEDNSAVSGVGNIAATAYVSTGFKVSQNMTPAAIWVKVFKTLIPVDNLEIQVWSDNAGSPLAALGAKGAISGKLISSDASGQWVRITGAFPALVAGTQYHLVFDKSAGVDAANFYQVRGYNGKHYPHGFYNNGTAVPAWTQATTAALCFFIENPAAQASLQSGGVFSDGKLQFFEGAPLNQSNARVKDLKDFAALDLSDFTLAIAGTAWTKDRTILDITYGLDHDRIVLRSNTVTGYAQLDVYDSAGTKKTVTGTVDISAGNSLLGIRVRAKGDGSDAVELWENGVKAAASLAAQTISFDKLFGAAKIGTLWIGGGWQVTPAWTKDTAMGVLPSADGWTWTTTTASVEANCMSVSGNKLYQNKNGYAAGGDGYYLKNALALSNANGWAVTSKQRISSAPNTKDSPAVMLQAADGAKYDGWIAAEYFVQDSNGGLVFYSQGDFRSTEHVLVKIGKGSDAMLFVDGRLVIDHTGQMLQVAATNQITFGDQSTVANENADVVYDYVKYYNTAWLAPQFTSGSLSELAIWNGDRTALLATLWNSGAPQSAKTVCGLQGNIGGKEPFVHRQSRIGITQSPTTTSVWTAVVMASEMEAFVVGENPAVSWSSAVINDTGNQYVVVQPYVDGRDVATNPPNSTSFAIATIITGAQNGLVGRSQNFAAPFGLHKMELRWAVSGGTGTLNAHARSIAVEART